MDSLSIGVLSGVVTVVVVAGGMKLYVLGYKHAMEYADQQLCALKAQFAELRKLSERVGPPKDVPCVGWIAVVPHQEAEAFEKLGKDIDRAVETQKDRDGEVERLETWWKAEGGEEK